MTAVVRAVGNETGFWWSHWGHLLTKSLGSCGLFVALHWLPLLWHGYGTPEPWAAGYALLLPVLYSLWRKNKLWPGCLTRETGVVVRDEIADTWAAAIGVLPWVVGWQWKVVVVAVGIIVLWPLKLHKWALP